MDATHPIVAAQTATSLPPQAGEPVHAEMPPDFDTFMDITPPPVMEAVYGHKVDPNAQAYAKEHTEPYRDPDRTTRTFQRGVVGVPFGNLPTFTNVPVDNHIVGNPGRSGQGLRGAPTTSNTYWLDYRLPRVSMPRDPAGSRTRTSTVSVSEMQRRRAHAPKNVPA